MPEIIDLRFLISVDEGPKIQPNNFDDLFDEDRSNNCRQNVQIDRCTMAISVFCIMLSWGDSVCCYQSTSNLLTTAAT